MRSAFRSVAFMFLVACSSARAPLDSPELLIDISIREPFRGVYRYTISFTPGEATGHVRESGILTRERRLAPQDVLWLTNLAETKLLSLRTIDNSSCSDCLETDMVVRVGSRTSTVRLVTGTHEPSIQKVLTRIWPGG